jgi:hypothetical protein
MKIALILIGCLINCLALCAQPFHLQGVVVTEQDEKPLTGASIFINNGSKGAITDSDGKFSLLDIGYNTFELVVSYVGYETIVVNISPENIGRRFRIKMSPKQIELEDVVVRAIEKDGWKKWGQTFIEHFLGKSANAEKCVLLNPQSLIFRHNKKMGVLEVSARDQLKIRNNALGYNINYQLERFEYNFPKGMVIYLGYSHFDDFSSTRRSAEHWNKARRSAYEGSITHFMQSFYDNKIVSKGFSMRQLIRINKRDTATRPIYNRIRNGDFSDVDTSKFFIQFGRKGGMFSDSIIHIVGKQQLSADSIKFTDPSTNHTLMFFKADVQVVYLKEKESSEYLKSHALLRKAGPQTSIFYFRGNTPIVVLQNGMYFQPLDIMAEGYWAFEKLAELLPSDYAIKND